MAALFALLQPERVRAGLGPGTQLTTVGAFGFDASPTSTRWFPQVLDHFENGPAPEKTWQQAYFMNDEHWDRNPASPIFLYVGGEGPLGSSSVTHNFVVDVLPKYHGLLFGVEHRYYGCHNTSSCPYTKPLDGNMHLQYLSSVQALADLAEFHTYATSQYDISPEARWIGIGGSYPGMLAAFLRATYPDKFAMSVASSAPVHGVLDMTSFEDIKADAYAMNVEGVRGSAECAATIADGHKAVKEKLQSPEGRSELATLFPTSVPDAKFLEDPDNRRTFAGCGVANFPSQANDPTCAEKHQGRACGISEICALLAERHADSPIQRLANLSAVQRVDSGNTVQNSSTGCEMDWEMPGGIPPGPTNYWGWQTCTEFGFYQTCETDTQCMYSQGLVGFLADPLKGAHQPNDFCSKDYNLTTNDTIARIAETNEYYQGKIAQATKIVWVNGDVDPWHKQSNYKVSPGHEQPVLPLVRGARHCAWMSVEKSTDQLAVKEARREIWETVDRWLAKPQPPSPPARRKLLLGFLTLKELLSLLAVALICAGCCCCLMQKRMTPIRNLLCPCCSCRYCSEPLEQPWQRGRAGLEDPLNAGPTDVDSLKASW